MWNLRRTFAWLVLVPLAILAALILSLPLILNSADYQALLISQAQEQLRRKVEMKRAHVEVFPYVRMTLDDVVIREADGREEFLSTAHLFIDLRIFPLLKRKVLAKRIALDMPKVKIKRGPDGKLNISDLFTATADTSGFTTPLLGEELSIADGEIAFEDTFGSALPRAVAFQHVNTTVKRTGLQLGYRFFAVVPQEAGDATITVTGEIARQAIEQAGAGGRATGRVEAKRVGLARFAPFLNDNVFLRGVQAPFDLAASYQYRWAEGTRALDIKDLTATDGKVTITGGFGLAKLFTPRLQFTASLTTTPFKLESLVASIPEEVIQSHSLGFLKDAQVAGAVQFVSLQVGWMPEQERRLTVQGEVDLSEGSAVVGAHRVPLSDVKGKLRVTADRIAIEQLTGRYGLAEATEGRGEV
ncbi:MAG: AsmA family protein, partial [Nitrospirae bacterium]